MYCYFLQSFIFRLLLLQSKLHSNFPKHFSLETCLNIVLSVLWKTAYKPLQKGFKSAFNSELPLQTRYITLQLFVVQVLLLSRGDYSNDNVKKTMCECVIIQSEKHSGIANNVENVAISSVFICEDFDCTHLK